MEARLGERGLGQPAGMYVFEALPPCPSAESARSLAAIVDELGFTSFRYCTERPFVSSELCEDAYVHHPKE